MIQKIVVANALRRSCVSKAFWSKCRKSSLPYAVSVYVAPLFASFEDVYQPMVRKSTRLIPRAELHQQWFDDLFGNELFEMLGTVGLPHLGDLFDERA